MTLSSSKIEGGLSLGLGGAVGLATSNPLIDFITSLLSSLPSNQLTFGLLKGWGIITSTSMGRIVTSIVLVGGLVYIIVKIFRIGKYGRGR